MFNPIDGLKADLTLSKNLHRVCVLGGFLIPLEATLEYFIGHEPVAIEGIVFDCALVIGSIITNVTSAKLEKKLNEQI